MLVGSECAIVIRRALHRGMAGRSNAVPQASYPALGVVRSGALTCLRRFSSAPDISTCVAGGMQTATRSLMPVFGGVGCFLAFDAACRHTMDFTGLTEYLPHQIGGMLGAFGCLSGVSLVAPEAAATLYAALTPAVGWVTRYLPVFLVPVQVMLPTIELPGGASEAAKLIGFLAGSWLCTLVLSSHLSLALKARFPQTAAMKASVGARAFVPKQTFKVALTWLLLASSCFCLELFDVYEGLDNVQTGHVQRVTRGICLAALGAGSFALAMKQGFPGHISMLISGLATIGGVATVAHVNDETYKAVVQRDYLTRDSTQLGSGDLLLWFLGPALVATGVQMFQYRARIVAFAPVLLGTCATMSLANILSSAAIAPRLGVSPDMALASTMRCVTIPLALPSYSRLCETNGSDKHVAFVALCAGVTGFLGFGFSRMVLSGVLCGRIPVSDAFPRGVATGVAAHVLGVATFAALEPEALAWGMLGMAASGVFSSAWVCSCPPVRDLVIRLVNSNQGKDVSVVFEC